MNFVHLKTRPVFELLKEVAFPLCAADRIEPTVSQCLKTFFPACFLANVKLLQGFGMDFSQALGFGNRHRYLRAMGIDIATF